jgi:hypothetical protein
VDLWINILNGISKSDCFAVNDVRGFSVPMFNAKKMLDCLKRIEKFIEKNVFSEKGE